MMRMRTGTPNGSGDHSEIAEDEIHATNMLHRIASYLSLGGDDDVDAEVPSAATWAVTSAAASHPLGTGNHRSAAALSDYHYYHSIRIMTPSSERVVKNNDDVTRQPLPLAMVDDCPVEAGDGVGVTIEDEEDWFVGGVNRLQNDSLEEQPPEMVALSSPPPGEGEFHDHPSRRIRERPAWTPAGQATCENEDQCQTFSAGCDIHEAERSPLHHHHHANNILIDRNHHENNQYGPDFFVERIRRQTKKRALQHKLAAAVFAHPHPLRQYCMDAYATALDLSMKRQKMQKQKQLVDSRNACDDDDDDDEYDESRSRAISGHHLRDPPETSLFVGHYPNSAMREHPAGYHHDLDELSRGGILHFVETMLMHSVPLSVLLELTESACGLSLATAAAAGHIGSGTVNKSASTLSDGARRVASVVSRVNPFHVFEAVVSAPRSAMGKTGDVLASGIQSVATGVGSVSNAALNRLSRQGLALAGGVVGGSRSGGMASGGYGRNRKDATKNSGGNNSNLESKLFRRLHKMENVSKLVSYSERSGEEAFSKHAKKRAQRMMHYNVSFMPFTATIQPCSPKKRGKPKPRISFEFQRPDHVESNNWGDRDVDNDSVSLESFNSSGSIFMRTPTSFPPTPTSRLYYFERGSRFTENVVFLARDQLRVERGMGNHNEQTRAMSKALIDGSRLAVFDAADAGNDIALSCGQHIATKVGNALYCSTRSMIPVMRNSYVYFEISVSPPATMNDPGMPIDRIEEPALSVGLSTLEMPLDTLVGVWQGTVGLCSTGQILHAGQWEATQESPYGSNSTVGCLVYLDDNSAYDTSKGRNVTADVTFNINGNIVPSSLGTNNTDMSDRIHPVSSRQSLAGGDGGEPTLSLIVPKAHELFPTVTLHSPASCVMCRFSAEDLVATSRAEIGALSGVVVYAVDGSVILDEGDEDDFFDSSVRSEIF